MKTIKIQLLLTSLCNFLILASILYIKSGETRINAKAEAKAIDYNQYFDNNKIDGTTLEHLALRELNLPSGKIIACDPLVGLGEHPAFVKTVSPGKYPVTACIAKTEKWGERYGRPKRR